MTQKFVIRLLTEDGELLAWCEEHIKPEANKAEGNCRFKVDSSTFRVLKGGTATFIAIHWCDLDVSRKMETFGGPFEIPESQVGGTARLDWMQAIWGVKGTTYVPKSVWIVQGDTGVPLPPVVVGSITLTPPTAAIGGGALRPVAV